MTNRANATRIWAATAALLLTAASGSPATARAQDTGKGKDLPKAETILDGYVAATGGKDAYAKVKNRVMKGTMEISGAGLKGKLVISQDDANNSLTAVEFEGIGKIKDGYDGTVAWESNPITGDRLITGDELADKVRDTAFRGDVEWRKLFTKVETVGEEDVDGKPAYKVVLTPEKGKPTTNYYDKTSNLLVKSARTINTQMGEVPVEAIPADYKEVDGIKLPFKATQKVLTQEIVVKFDTIEQNVDLPKDTFALPKEIKDLADKAKAK